jgi:CheY-like chemotaxis protein
MCHPDPLLSVSKILFIDDEPGDNDRARRALDRLGFDVTACDNAPDGLRLLQDGTDWSGVVLDMMMPEPLEWQGRMAHGITGLKVLEEAREVIIEKNIPVMVFTNRRTDTLKEHLDQLNIPEHLLGRQEKDALEPADFAERLFEFVGNAHRGMPMGPGSWI